MMETDDSRSLQHVLGLACITADPYGSTTGSWTLSIVSGTTPCSTTFTVTGPKH